MLNVTHIVNSVFTSRTYILTDDGKKDFWIVDCGDVPPLIAMISSFGGNSFTIKGVLLTHVHYDHIYGLPRLKEMFPDIRAYTNEAGSKALPNPKLNMSKYHDDPIIYEAENVMTCREGVHKDCEQQHDVIDLFDGVQAKVFETPGHHPSCLTYEIGDYLFTGDAYIPGEKVVTILPGADKALAAESLERIKRMAEGKVVCPGHET